MQCKVNQVFIFIEFRHWNVLETVMNCKVPFAAIFFFFSSYFFENTFFSLYAMSICCVVFFLVSIKLICRFISSKDGREGEQLSTLNIYPRMELCARFKFCFSIWIFWYRESNEMQTNLSCSLSLCMCVSLSFHR